MPWWAYHGLCGVQKTLQHMAGPGVEEQPTQHPLVQHSKAWILSVIRIFKAQRETLWEKCNHRSGCTTTVHWHVHMSRHGDKSWCRKTNETRDEEFVKIPDLIPHKWRILSQCRGSLWHFHTHAWMKPCGTLMRRRHVWMSECHSF